MLHKLASVATTVYDPAVAVYGLDCVTPFTVKTTAPVPPEVLKLIVPLPPLHNGFVELDSRLNTAGCDTVTTLELEQLTASVATIVYVPAAAAIGLVEVTPFTV